MPLSAPRPGPAEETARLQLWKQQEFHNWLRWTICKKGFDWSKPIVIGLLAIGFAVLVVYGMQTGHWYITAGGVVLWFTIVNLAFFTYFGLMLPGPPRVVPGPFAPGQTIEGTMAVYPPGYNGRKLARVLVRVPAAEGEPWLLELVFPQLPPEFAELIRQQEMWRIQRADAPATVCQIETLSVTRSDINEGMHPVRVVGSSWDPNTARGFFSTEKK